MSNMLAPFLGDCGIAGIRIFVLRVSYLTLAELSTFFLFSRKRLEIRGRCAMAKKFRPLKRTLRQGVVAGWGSVAGSLIRKVAPSLVLLVAEMEPPWRAMRL
jgi:hypothetical protein